MGKCWSFKSLLQVIVDVAALAWSCLDQYSAGMEARGISAAGMQTIRATG